VAGVTDPGEGFAVELEVDDDPPVLRVTGDIDIESAPALTEAVAQVEAERPEGPVVFDLAAVRFIDSSGLTVLVNTVNGGRQVIVRNASSIVRRVIQATGLEALMEVEP